MHFVCGDHITFALSTSRTHQLVFQRSVIGVISFLLKPEPLYLTSDSFWLVPFCRAQAEQQPKIAMTLDQIRGLRERSNALKGYL